MKSSTFNPYREHNFKVQSHTQLYFPPTAINRYLLLQERFLPYERQLGVEGCGEAMAPTATEHCMG
jgi:hypothetical protein